MWETRNNNNNNNILKLYGWKAIEKVVKNDPSERERERLTVAGLHLLQRKCLRLDHIYGQIKIYVCFIHLTAEKKKKKKKKIIVE